MNWVEKKAMDKFFQSKSKAQMAEFLTESVEKSIDKYLHKYRKANPDKSEPEIFKHCVTSPIYFEADKDFVAYCEKAGLNKRERDTILRRVIRRGDTTVQLRSDHVGRNDKCPCNSGLKYKKCCGVSA